LEWWITGEGGWMGMEWINMTSTIWRRKMKMIMMTILLIKYRKKIKEGIGRKIRRKIRRKRNWKMKKLEM
jgi:hypothetical protein